MRGEEEAAPPQARALWGLSRLRLCLFLLLLLAPSSAVQGENTELPTFSATSGLHSVLEDTISPAFSATVLIIITVIISGSAYLCFLKYICAGCCKSTQVVPVRRLDQSRFEEQV